MATWRSAPLAAPALMLLAGVQTVVCMDRLDPLCNVTKAIRCYWDQAHVYGVDVLKPKPEEQEKFLNNVCATKTELPEYPMCSAYYNACSDEQKKWFGDHENGYKQLREKITDPLMCRIVQRLLTCFDKTVVQQCTVKFDKKYTPDNAEKNYNAAKVLSNCVKPALEPCKEKDQTVLKSYLNEIAEAVTKLYTYKTVPPTSAPPTTPAATEAPTTLAPITPTTPESTTHLPTTPQSTTQKPTTHQSSTLPPTTPTQPSAAPSVHAVSAFGFIALALLVRGA